MTTLTTTMTGGFGDGWWWGEGDLPITTGGNADYWTGTVKYTPIHPVPPPPPQVVVNPVVYLPQIQAVTQAPEAPKPKRRRESITDNVFALLYCVLCWVFGRDER